VGTAQRVPPYRADALSSTSELPCYINFCVDQRLNRPISLAAEEVREPRRTRPFVQIEPRSLCELIGGPTVANGSTKLSAPTDPP
jgi:hypothetical protein